MNFSLPPLTLVVGGASSGKSAYAEGLVESSGKSMTYIATAQAFDEEMRRKIDIHVSRRGVGWTTIEAPMDLGPALQTLGADQVCLLDCATLWLTNQMLAEVDLETAQSDLMDAIARCPAPLVIVSNEVGHGIVPDTRLGRQFRDAQGRLNIVLAQAADVVVQVTMGLPHALKGSLP